MLIILFERINTFQIYKCSVDLMGKDTSTDHPLPRRVARPLLQHHLPVHLQAVHPQVHLQSEVQLSEAQLQHQVQQQLDQIELQLENVGASVCVSLRIIANRVYSYLLNWIQTKLNR